MGQSQSEGLIFPVAQEAVSVQLIIISIQSKHDGVVRRLGSIKAIRYETDLGRGSAQVEGARRFRALQKDSHCQKMWKDAFMFPQMHLTAHLFKALIQVVNRDPPEGAFLLTTQCS